jgi:hypothetical protein
MKRGKPAHFARIWFILHDDLGQPHSPPLDVRPDNFVALFMKASSLIPKNKHIEGRS